MFTRLETALPPGRFVEPIFVARPEWKSCRLDRLAGRPAGQPGRLMDSVSLASRSIRFRPQAAVRYGLIEPERQRTDSVGVIPNCMILPETKPAANTRP